MVCSNYSFSFYGCNHVTSGVMWSLVCLTHSSVRCGWSLWCPGFPGTPRRRPWFWTGRRCRRSARRGASGSGGTTSPCRKTQRSRNFLKVQTIFFKIFKLKTSCRADMNKPNAFCKTLRKQSIKQIVSFLCRFSASWNKTLSSRPQFIYLFTFSVFCWFWGDRINSAFRWRIRFKSLRPGLKSTSGLI